MRVEPGATRSTKGLSSMKEHLPRERPSIALPAMKIGRIPILNIQPVIDCGRWPAKAVEGETIEVSATVFREGHEMLGAAVVLRPPGARPGPLLHMSEKAPGTDRLAAEITPTETGLWHFRVEAW